MNMARERVALLGGSFDPIHNGHLGIITTILNSGAADQVWVVPCGHRQDKRPDAEPHQRVTLCEEALRGYSNDKRSGKPRVRVESVEAVGEVRTPGTMGLIDHLRESNPTLEFSFVVGADLLPSLATWKQVERLQREVRFLLVERPGTSTVLPAGFQIDRLPGSDGAAQAISSSLIRRLLREGKSVDGYVPESVLRAITRYGLYGSPPPRGDQLLYRGKWLSLLERNGWEMTERQGCTGIAAIVAMTAERKLLLTEQYRPPIGTTAIEIPAGLVGDKEDKKEEVATAAVRELEEETGYKAEKITHLFRGPSSAGLSSEVLDFYLAEKLTRTGKGGGDETESITVHEVSLEETPAWLQQQAKRGAMIDPKVYMALYFLGARSKKEE